MIDFLTIYFGLLLLSGLIKRGDGPQQPHMVLMLPLILIDCMASVLVGESFMTTLSAKAYDSALDGHRYWSWCASFIDTLFFWQEQHCKSQWLQEQLHGSVWQAWYANFTEQ